MKLFISFVMSFLVVANVNLVQAANIHYDVTLIFIDDTTFRGSFDYDSTNRQISNFQGELDDVLMGNIESLYYNIGYIDDGRGGITAYLFALNTNVINTNPPVNNNVGVAINFNAINPTLGATRPDQLAYMDCSAGGLMGKTCMYYLSWHNPVVPMEGGHGVLSQTITASSPQARTDCLLNWAEINYPNLFSPKGSASQILAPYYYRYYQNTNSYVGVSSANSHVYYLGPDGNLQDVGSLSTWLNSSGC